MPVHLVDGTFELFRCFHGAPPAIDADGNPVGAIRALLATFGKLLRTATHVVVVFDAMAPPRRGDRSPDAALKAQGRLAVEASRALGLPTWVAARGQADDVLASAAHTLRDRVDVVICTTDRDLLQAVRGTNVVCWDRIRDRITDEAGVRLRLGVAPHLVPDLAALAGDPSDGLPGVPGFGPKSAALVLDAHGGLDAIPDRYEDWKVRPRGAERLAAALRRHREDARIVRAVATLRTDLVPELDPDRLAWRGADPELAALARRVGAEEWFARWSAR